jgi:hypothetical protein
VSRFRSSQRIQHSLHGGVAYDCWLTPATCRLPLRGHSLCDPPDHMAYTLIRPFGSCLCSLHRRRINARRQWTIPILTIPSSDSVLLFLCRGESAAFHVRRLPHVHFQSTCLCYNHTRRLVGSRAAASQSCQPAANQSYRVVNCWDSFWHIDTGDTCAKDAGRGTAHEAQRVCALDDT